MRHPLKAKEETPSLTHRETELLSNGVCLTLAQARNCAD